jgi:hypothetical protein
MLVEIDRIEKSGIRKLRGRELLFFAGLCSLARHSARLWAPVKEGGEGTGTGTGQAKEIDWGEVFAADCIGFAASGGNPVVAIAFSIADIIVQSAA